jgi:orotate phosphoribosyltransferase
VQSEPSTNIVLQPVASGSTINLRSLIDSVCIAREKVHVVISPSGGQQSWLIDLRAAFMDAVLLKQICDAMLVRCPDTPFQFAGMETAAIPLLTGLLVHGSNRDHPLSGLIIRKERKPTGLGKTVEGKITKDPVILVDDVFNSGDSAEKARVSLEAEGIKLERMLVVIDYQSKTGKAWQQTHGIEVQSLFKLPEFKLSLGEKKPPARKHRYLKKLWHHKASDPYPYYVVPKSAPLLVGNRLIYGTDTGSMRAIDCDSGRLAWRFKAPGTQTKGIWSSPQHHDGRIYFGAYNGNVYCLDAATGEKVWDQPYCEWIGSTPCLAPENGHLYIGLEYERPREQGSIAALDLTTGEKVWEHFLKVYQHGSCSYWKEGNLVVSGINDGVTKPAAPSNTCHASTMTGRSSCARRSTARSTCWTCATAEKLQNFRQTTSATRNR